MRPSLFKDILFQFKNAIQFFFSLFYPFPCYIRSTSYYSCFSFRSLILLWEAYRPGNSSIVVTTGVRKWTTEQFLIVWFAFTHWLNALPHTTQCPSAFYERELHPEPDALFCFKCCFPLCTRCSFRCSAGNEKNIDWLLMLKWRKK